MEVLGEEEGGFCDWGFEPSPKIIRECVIPDSKEKGVGFDDHPLAIEGDISIVSVVAELSHLGHQEGAAQAHVL